MAQDRPLPLRSEALRPLATLAVVHKGGAAYYTELRRSADPIIAAGAWCTLLDAKLVPQALWDEVIAQCTVGAIRRRAFDYFEEIYEHGLAAKALAAPASAAANAEDAARRAALALDWPAATEAAGALYLATGDLGQLQRASEFADLAGGWRPSLEWALRAVAIAPLTPIPLQRVFTVLDDAGQGVLMGEVAEILMARNLHLTVAQVFAASAALKQGDAAGALTRLKPFDDRRILQDNAVAPYFGAIRAIQGAAEDKLGHYQQSYAIYLALKAAEKPPNVDPENFYRGTAARGALPIPPLPPDPRRDVVQMLGFPRSGTTLLENALAAHPRVETFEEIPALNAAIDQIERVLLGKAPKPAHPEDTYLAARAKYYEEIDRRRRKPGADVLIDKLPIRSADTALLGKLFADWRYIFSIRHPYDVALSCFKQRFSPNPAMENFRTIAGTARAYDHAMTQWFNRFSLDDPRVAYVRYDELVTDFERVTRGVLGFLGVDWDDAVRDFAAAAETRAAKTPSYQKVRQGLALGVQTSWRNYGSLFQSKEAAPLTKWARFFGYPVE